MELILNKSRTYASLVMFEHTLFALPFAYLALFLASGGWPSFHDFFWVTVAMVGARNGANAWNRLADEEIDRKNPRTSGRHLPRGLVSRKEVLLLALFCFGLLVLAASQLTPICIKLLPLAVILVIFYSYTKRFTWTCHLFLGLADAAAPVGAWLAVTGYFHPAAILLGAVHALWIAGFDIIYATQDYEFDIREGVHSIPARFGINRALIIARIMHFFTILLLTGFFYFFTLGWIYFLGLITITCLLVYEHLLVSPDDLSRVHTAAYSVNQIIGPLLFFSVVLDLLV